MPLAQLPPTAVSSPILLPTSTSPSATATLPSSPTATLLPSPTKVITVTASPSPATSIPVTRDPDRDPEGCRLAPALRHVRPKWTVRPGPWPRPAAAPGLLGQRPAADPPLIHLGFDVEGDPYYVEALLDVLDRRRVRTTMFVLGSWADTNPEWTQEMARRGHEIASHAYSHADLSAMEAADIQHELRHTELSLQSLTGQSPRPWLRPPFGSYSEISLGAAYEAGYTTVIWSGSANDWQPEMDADAMCETLRYYAIPGAILYAHTNRAAIVEAADRFIAEMQAEGYTFVPLSVLMAEEPATWLERGEIGD